MNLRRYEGQDRYNLEADLKTVLPGGKNAAMVLRSKIFAHPREADNCLVIAGDQDSSGCLVWDVNSKERLQAINCNSPAFDFSLVSINNQDPLLACLTSDKIFVNRWNG